MSAQPLNALGVSVGQPHRLDLNGDAHLQQLNGQNLQVQNQGLQGTRSERRNDPQTTQTRRDGWQAVERFYNAGTEHAEHRQAGWEDFSGQRNRSGGSQPLIGQRGQVAIDQPQPPFTKTPLAQAIGNWAERAGEFEEWGRTHAGRYGAKTSVDLPEGDTQPEAKVSRPGGRGYRRPFTVG